MRKPKIKAESDREHRKKLKSMEDYTPTEEDREKQSFVLKKGFRCYPVLMDRKNRSLMTLESQFMNREPKRSKEDPFDKKYLSFRVTRYYNLMYERLMKKS